MGKKQPAPGAGKKPRLEGADITRFFDLRPGHHPEQQDAQRIEGHGKPVSSPTLQPSAEGRSLLGGGDGGGGPSVAAAQPRPLLHRHLAALQDLVPADSFSMSQDTDAMQVVWQDSPGSSSQAQGRSLSNLGRSAAYGAREFNAIKQRLISAAQKPRDVRRPAAPALPGGGRLQQSEQFLEGLLARHQPAAAPVAAPAAPVAAPAAGPEHSTQSGAASDLAAPWAGGGTTHRTPGTHLRGILKRRSGCGTSGGKQTPASCVKFSLTTSAGKGGRGRAGGAQVGSSGKKRQAGQKRKALLDLLDQVESIVHSGGSPEEGEQEESGCQDAAAEPETIDAGAVSDKENAGQGVSSQEKTVPPALTAAAGPTGSQQLMPPPGGLRCCGGPQPPATIVQQQQSAAQPQAVAGLQHSQQPAAAEVQQIQAQQGSGGFADEDEDEDDALMAQLELQLLTQVEQRQAAARQAPPPARAGRQCQPANPRAAPGLSAPQADPARQQAAPPAAQHPAALLQQQQHQSAGFKPLPRSPYEKGLRGAPVVLTAASAAPAAAATAAMASSAPAAGTTAPAPAAADLQGSDSWDDDFDADLFDQFEAAALQEQADRNQKGGAPPSGTAAAQEQQPGVTQGDGQPPSAAALGPCYPGNREEVHYQIKGIFPSEHEQLLLLHNKYKKRDVYAHLRTPWSDLPYRIGDTVNILAELDFFDGHHHCLLTMERGMLILHPDLLLSGTRITTSHDCPRRSYLDEKVAGNGSNDKAVKGTLTHNLIQAALTEGLRTPQQLHAKAEVVVCEATEALLEVELSEEAALQCLKQAVPGVLRWMHRFLRDDPAPDAQLRAGMDYSTGKDIHRMVAVQEVLDIEESIWSTKYGVKGMIDISTQLVLDDLAPPPRGGPQPTGWMQAASSGRQHPQQPLAAAGASREVVVGPVEIKTGKMHDSHRAQVLLYLLLMEERYGRPLEWGMLWYTTQPDPQLVMKRPVDLSCLMAVRNRLAAALAIREMPPLSEDKRQCNWCFQRLNCAIAHRAEKGTAGTADTFVRASTDRGGNLDRIQEELAGKYERAAGHMAAADCEFLTKWEHLVTVEEAHSTSRRPDIWAMEGAERQQLGRCVAGLALSHVDEQQLLYTFCRPAGGAIQCNFSDGEMVLLSVEGQHVAVARGFFYTCTATHMTVSFNKALRKGLLKPGGTPGDAAAAAGVAGAAGAASSSAAFDGSVRWRLDRDEASSTFVRLRGNLFSLFRREFQTSQDADTRKLSYGAELAQSQHAGKLRRLIVELAPPRYRAADPTQPDPTPAGMNSEQHDAVQRVLCAQDYTLVLGMPGAGKTTTIVSMVQALVSQGKSVLLTSYTNSAVDNILMKLAREEAPFVRLGREAGVHPAVRPWLPGGERYPRKTTRELARLSETIPVFGATCFGVNHAMLKDKLFDVCIIDEAGQMVLPASLGPLLKARSFVLVGDHNQLPPLVTSKEAEAGGLGESLFKRLSDAHPQAVVSLPVQYRMAEDIMLLPNALIYNNALRCGTDGVAQAALQLPASVAGYLPTLPGWLQAALDPQRRVLFLDTAQVEGAREAVAGDAMSNSGEAQLVLRLVQAAVAAGVAQDQLGIISPYRSQVALLDRLAKEAQLSEVEVLTIDKCQGRDKDCIVLSLVRSNTEGEAGKLLADWRRINVAITRARMKLVLVGDASTLRTVPLFGRLVALVQERGWYLSLPPAALLQQQQQQ